jgi:hypothetical protein
VSVITPPAIPAEKRTRVLINVHGGGFNSDSGSLVEGVPIANLSQTTVVSVYYRLAPEHPFPAAVEDTVAVYKDLLKTYKPGRVGCSALRPAPFSLLKWLWRCGATVCRFPPPFRLRRWSRLPTGTSTGQQCSAGTPVPARVISRPLVVASSLAWTWAYGRRKSRKT